MFVDGVSIRPRGPVVRATVRMGSAKPITGRIVVVYQTQEFDCVGRRWRMVAFDARDEYDATVERRVLEGPLLAAAPGTIAARSLETVCFMAKALPTYRPSVKQ